MTDARFVAAGLVLFAVLAPVLAGQKSTATSLPPEHPLCHPESGVTYSGSLSGEGLTNMLHEGELLRSVQLPPHELILKWPQPVSFNLHRVQWMDAKTYASHYGLEYWDMDQLEYVLLYEESDHEGEHSEHRFAAVTTTSIRFTIFEHPIGYASTALRGFSLTHEKKQRGAMVKSD